MLKTGLYRAIKSGNQNNSYDITMKVKETDKSYVFELIDIHSEYEAVHIEQLFEKSKRKTIKKNKSGHGIDVMDIDWFVFYPFQIGVPYLFKLQQ